MQITLNQEEIEQAIEAFVRTRITIADNQKVMMDLKAGRGDNGFSASLDIRPAPVQPGNNSGIRSTGAAAPRPANLRRITETPEDRTEVVAEDQAPENKEVGRDIPEVSAESADAEIAPAKSTTDEKPEHRKGSIFNFANKASGGVGA